MHRAGVEGSCCFSSLFFSLSLFLLCVMCVCCFFPSHVFPLNPHIFFPLNPHIARARGVVPRVERPLNVVVGIRSVKRYKMGSHEAKP